MMRELIVDRPQIGFYLIRLGKNTPFVPCEIGLYGEEFSVLAASICGEPADPVWVWQRAAGRPIEKADYDYRLACYEYDQKFDPDSPLANPRRAVDLATMKPSF